MVNAYKYSAREGKVSIAFEYKPYVNPERYVGEIHVAVKDGGVGIKVEKMKILTRILKSNKLNL